MMASSRPPNEVKVGPSLFQAITVVVDVIKWIFEIKFHVLGG